MIKISRIIAHSVLAISIFASLVRGVPEQPGLRADSSTGRSKSESERWIETLSWSPRAFLYHNFLSEEETMHIISIAKPLMRRSTVIGLDGQDVETGIRTSYGTFISRMSDNIITDIEERIAKWTHMNISHQEDLQVLRYGPGQEYKAHYDSIVETSPRIATVILYLNNVEKGGETAFPRTTPRETIPVNAEMFSSCARNSVAVKPRKGDALLFFSMNPDMSSDSASLHAGCPVIEGVKWTATKWIHTAAFRPESLGQYVDRPRLPEDCIDYHRKCGLWAKEGECKSNPKYMIGDAFLLGTCRLSCRACEQCKEGDRACATRNRVQAGYLPLTDGEI